MRSTLDLLFRHALRVGKRARTETAIGRGTASISHAAVEMVTDRLGSLVGRDVLVVGAGDMGAGVATALHRAGAAKITVCNRSPHRGSRLAGQVGGRAIGLDRIGEALAACDVVVACTASDHSVLTRDDVEANHPAGKPLLIVDISVPRTVDHSVGDLDAVTLLDLDDLPRLGRSSASSCAPPRPTGCAGSWPRSWTSTRSSRWPARLRRSSPSSTSVPRPCGPVSCRGSPGVSPGSTTAEREAVEALTSAIVAKLLHEPSVRLRSDAGTPKGERNAAAVSDLFDLALSVLLRLATRGSPQARTQTEAVADALRPHPAARSSSCSSRRPATVSAMCRCT